MLGEQPSCVDGVAPARGIVPPEAAEGELLVNQQAGTAGSRLNSSIVVPASVPAQQPQASRSAATRGASCSRVPEARYQLAPGETSPRSGASAPGNTKVTRATFPPRSSTCDRPVPKTLCLFHAGGVTGRRRERHQPHPAGQASAADVVLAQSDQVPGRQSGERLRRREEAPLQQRQHREHRHADEEGDDEGAAVPGRRLGRHFG